MLKSSRHSRFPFSTAVLTSKPGINNVTSTFSSGPSVNIFIPTHIFSVIGSGTRSGLLFGYEQKVPGKNLVHLNITALLPVNEGQLEELINNKKALLDKDLEQSYSDEQMPHSQPNLRYQPKSNFSVVPNKNHTFSTSFSSPKKKKKKKIIFLGELVGVSAEGKNDQKYCDQLFQLKQLWKEQHFHLVLSFNDKFWPSSLNSTSFFGNCNPIPYASLKLVSIKQTLENEHFQSIEVGQVTMLYYDTGNFMSSQLLNRFNTEDERVDFLEFIYESLKSTAQMVAEEEASTSTILLSPQSLKAQKQSRKSVTLKEEKVTVNDRKERKSEENYRHFQSKTENTKNNSHTHKNHTPSDQGQNFLLSSLLLLLLPRSLIRAFLYFSSPARQLHSSSAPNGGPSKANSLNLEGSGPIAFTSWLLSPLAALSESSYFVSKSATVTQLKYRLLQLAICWRLLQRELIARRRISLSLGNALSSVLIDVALGVATIVALHSLSTPAYWLERAWLYADSMVDDVDRLLRVLQSMPAGLKLNRPLNMALSQFYLYHIYLWESYMDIIRPVFGLVMQAIFYLGIFGFTCILSLLSDIFSLVTIHIYCFYGYGCQLYGLQVSGIAALWRLFRGKKYNQLRNRVDSYSYDNEQLFIGTILFTVLLFLLPTVFMYYLVFLVLRFLTLAVQEGLFFFIEHISSMPLYTLILWLFNSRTVSGQVYLEVIGTSGLGPNLTSSASNNENSHPEEVNKNGVNGLAAGSPLIVRLQTKRISLLSIITSRYDDMLQSLHAYRLSSSARQLTWNEFFQSILSGRLLHQNLSIGLSLLLFIGYLLLIVYFALISVSK